VLKHVQRKASQGGYEAASERFYEAAAQHLGCQHDEIALSKTPLAPRIWPSTQWLSSLLTTSSPLHHLQVAEHTGGLVEVIPNYATLISTLRRWW
jgi:hypothetical protein